MTEFAAFGHVVDIHVRVTFFIEAALPYLRAVDVVIAAHVVKHYGYLCAVYRKRAYRTDYEIIVGIFLGVASRYRYEHIGGNDTVNAYHSVGGHTF